MYLNVSTVHFQFLLNKLNKKNKKNKKKRKKKRKLIKFVCVLWGKKWT